MAVEAGSSKTFKVFGEDIVFNKASDAYNNLRKKYFALSEEAAETMGKFYDAEIHTIEDYRGKIKNYCEALIYKYINTGVLDLISLGVYNIDEEIFERAFYEEFSSETLAAIDEVCGKINAIEAEQERQKELSKEAVDDAGHTIETVGYIGDGSLGGTLSAMVKSKITDSIINGAAKGATKLLTLGADKIGDVFADKEKKNLINDSANRENLIDGIRNDVFLIHKTVAKIVNAKFPETFQYASDETLDEIEPIIHNIIRGNFTAEQPDMSLVEEQVKKMLLINPYDFRLYGFLVSLAGRIDDELKEILPYFGADIDYLASSYLSTLYDFKDYPDYESAIVLVTEVENRLRNFAIDSCEFYEKVKQHKNRLFAIRCTFHENVYESIEARDAAELQYKEFYAEKSVSEMKLEEIVGKYIESFGGRLEPFNTAYVKRELELAATPFINKSASIVLLDKYVDRIKSAANETSEQDTNMVETLEKRKKWLKTKAKILSFFGTITSAIFGFFRKFNLVGNLIKKFKKNKKEKLGKGIKKNKKAEETKNEVAQVLETPKSEVTPVADEVKAGETPVVEITKEAAPDLVPEYKECPSCGNKVKATGKFCGKCGYKFQ